MQDIKETKFLHLDNQLFRLDPRALHFDLTVEDDQGRGTYMLAQNLTHAAILIAGFAHSHSVNRIKEMLSDNCNERTAAA